jgi:hypothetical protein
MPHIASSAFDAEAFGAPFYRVHDIDALSIPQELRAIRDTTASLIVDAKVTADDVEGTRLLWSLGFRKVCMQITLRHDLGDVGEVPADVAVVLTLALPESVLQQHADNFKFDRFNLDPLLSRDSTRRL